MNQNVPKPMLFGLDPVGTLTFYFSKKHFFYAVTLYAKHIFQAPPGPRWSAHGGPIQGPDGAPLQGPSRSHMERPCRAHPGAYPGPWGEAAGPGPGPGRTLRSQPGPLPSRHCAIAPREKIRRSGEPRCDLQVCIFGAVPSSLSRFLTPRSRGPPLAKRC